MLEFQRLRMSIKEVWLLPAFLQEDHCGNRSKCHMSELSIRGILHSVISPLGDCCCHSAELECLLINFNVAICVCTECWLLLSRPFHSGRTWSAHFPHIKQPIRVCTIKHGVFPLPTHSLWVQQSSLTLIRLKTNHGLDCLSVLKSEHPIVLY